MQFRTFIFVGRASWRSSDIEDIGRLDGEDHSNSNPGVHTNSWHPGANISINTFGLALSILYRH